MCESSDQRLHEPYVVSQPGDKKEQRSLAGQTAPPNENNYL
jgi:hypothetical protein